MMLKSMVWNMWRWGNALKVFGFKILFSHYRLMRYPHVCCICSRQTLPHESFYSCKICKNYNICEYCVSYQSQHCHHFYKDTLPLIVDSSDIWRANTTAECLEMAFQMYSVRQCLGWRATSSDHSIDLGGYEWLTYKEVHLQAHSIGTGMKLLPCEKVQFVGLLCGMCREWIITDLACTLKGLPLVPMHRSTTVEQLLHIMDQVDMSIIILSVHLAHVLLEVLKRSDVCSVQHVILVDDCSNVSTNTPTNGQPSGQPSSEPCGQSTGQPFEQPSIPCPLDSLLSVQLSQQFEAFNCVVTSWDHVLSSGHRVSARTRMEVFIAPPDHICKLLPSSGASGVVPKLTILLENMQCSNSSISDKVC